jgi:hypothetical protein
MDGDFLVSQERTAQPGREHKRDPESSRILALKFKHYGKQPTRGSVFSICCNLLINPSNG